MPGPPRKPTKLELLQGKPGKRPINDAEPDPPTRVPKCPAHLSDAARREWRGITKELKVLGLISRIDRAALAAYCQAYGRWSEAEEEVKRHGLVVKAPSGYPIQNPYLAIANKALEQMHKFLTEFGMTPSSRTRVKVEKPDEESPFQKFLQRKKRR